MLDSAHRVQGTVDVMKTPTNQIRRDLLLALSGGLLAASSPASARVGLLGGATRPKEPKGGIPVTITGNRAVATIEVSVLGLGLVTIEMILDFDQPVNLTASSLGISAGLTSVLDLVGRIDLLRVQLALPIMITVEPPAGEGLSFANVVAVELHTEALSFLPLSVFRLYKAPIGGTFFDITDDVLPGSVRTRGRSGEFSQFLIVTDLLQISSPPAAYAADAQAKYLFLASRLQSPLVNPKARAVLETDLAASRLAYDAADYATARAGIATFGARVKSFGPTYVPNRWRAARDLDNVAGSLLGEASSLDFTLRRLGG
mgnify:FL=1